MTGFISGNEQKLAEMSKLAGYQALFMQSNNDTHMDKR